MGDTLLFPNENYKRVFAVQKSFGPAGVRLLDPGRVLIGEGRLMKQSRRGPQPKAFFLFNDMLVYGTIVINGRWLKNQKICPLADIKLEDLEDGYMRNQWLIQTPGKSFYVSATSQEEKQAWMEHIEVCKTRLLQSSGRRASSIFAVRWIPDPASAICMRCSSKFTMTHRRHHCRKCGLLVCGYCSKKRAVISHIHPTKRLRVCTKCHSSLRESDMGNSFRQRSGAVLGSEGGDRVRGDSSGLKSDEEEQASEDDYVDQTDEDYDPIYWVDTGMDSFSPYVCFKPEHVWPPA